MPNKDYDIDKFYFCEQSKESVEKSYELITQRIDKGFYAKQKVNLPTEIIPLVIDEEKDWLTHFKKDELDLIIHCMSLHWVNNIEHLLNNFKETLVPDGAFMGAMIGGDSL